MRMLGGIAVAAALAASSAHALDCERPTFEAAAAPFPMSQAPAWQPDGEGFLFYRAFPNENNQLVTRARDDLTGETEVCLTCGQPGPNQVAHYRPQGDAILFHSWRGRTFTIGGPGYGGIGSSVIVANADGSDPVNLTNGQEGEDDFHAYFSPDGKRVVWTHVDGDIQNGGLALFDVRVADYVVDENGPRLENVRVVRPPNGHFYESQWWSPDGRGFLYTESIDHAVNLELFFMDLSVEPPSIRRLTNHPAWDEQALFTPDGKRVIFMSTRAAKESSWHAISSVSATLGLPAAIDNLLILPLFAGSFFTPVLPPSTDLYEIDLATNALRRLTVDGDAGWITPEFAWNPALAANPDGPQELLWSELRLPDSIRISSLRNPVAELGELAGIVDSPPKIDPSGGALSAATEVRTRIARYACD